MVGLADWHSQDGMQAGDTPWLLQNGTEAVSRGLTGLGKGINAYQATQAEENSRGTLGKLLAGANSVDDLRNRMTPEALGSLNNQDRNTLFDRMDQFGLNKSRSISDLLNQGKLNNLGQEQQDAHSLNTANINHSNALAAQQLLEARERGETTAGANQAAQVRSTLGNLGTSERLSAIQAGASGLTGSRLRAYQSAFPELGQSFNDDTPGGGNYGNAPILGNNPINTKLYNDVNNKLAGTKYQAGIVNNADAQQQSTLPVEKTVEAMGLKGDQANDLINNAKAYAVNHPGTNPNKIAYLMHTSMREKPADQNNFVDDYLKNEPKQQAFVSSYNTLNHLHETANKLTDQFARDQAMLRSNPNASKHLKDLADIHHKALDTALAQLHAYDLDQVVPLNIGKTSEPTNANYTNPFFINSQGSVVPLGA